MNYNIPLVPDHYLLMHILLTNDDGFSAPGLLALAQAMRSLGQVTVLAPDHNWSASGHVKTLDRPIRVKETLLSDGTPALASDGAPSDCVALAILGLLPEKIDMVVSGINSNANLGHDVTYSGTVTAAMEAAIWGLPAISVSLDAPEHQTRSGACASPARACACTAICWSLAATRAAALITGLAAKPPPACRKMAPTSAPWRMEPSRSLHCTWI